MSKPKIEVNYYEAPGQNYQQPSNNCQQQPNQNIESEGLIQDILWIPLGFLFLIFISPIVMGGARYVERPSQPSPPVIINNRN